MKCERCGNIIEEGNVYCGVCGKEVMLVPEYNVLEDDFLPSIIADEPKAESSQAAPISGKRRRSRKTTRIKRVFKYYLPAMFVALLIVVLGMVIYSNSYSFYVKNARILDEKKEYRKAISAYEMALSRKKTPEAFMARGRDYFRIKAYDYAEEDFLSALLLKPNDPRSYRLLIKLYIRTEDDEGLDKLYKSTDNEKIRAMFGENRIAPPEFSEFEGSYDEPITLELFSEKGYEIYYTTDGSDPTEDGEEYISEDPIHLENGSTLVSAVCRDNGEWGRVVSRMYNIGDGIPNEPIATPEEGVYHEQIEIELKTSSLDAEIYYSWSGEEPTEDSLYYDGPIKLPEGENELTAVAISQSGVKSSVMRAEYTYKP